MNNSELINDVKLGNKSYYKKKIEFRLATIIF